MSIARALRLAIAERPTRRDRLNGAWWPYSTNVDVELAPLLEAVGRRFRTVLEVLLDQEEWEPLPPSWQPASAGGATLTWRAMPEPHLAILRCRQRCWLTLLVLAPDTPEDVALTATLMAMQPGNALTTTQVLGGAQVRAAERIGAPGVAAR